VSYHVKGYAAHSPTSRLGLFEFDRRSPRPDDVVIEILYCGVCHSNLHNRTNTAWSSCWATPAEQAIRATA